MSLLKTLVIYGTILSLVGTVGYQRYKDMEKAREAAENPDDTVTATESLTPEERAQRAMEMEREKEEAWQAKMKAFEAKLEAEAEKER